MNQRHCTFCGEQQTKETPLMLVPSMKAGESPLDPEERAVRNHIGLCRVCLRKMKLHLGKESFDGLEYYCHFCGHQPKDANGLAIGPMASACEGCLEHGERFFADLENLNL